LCELFPATPVILRQAVFNGNDGVTITETGQLPDHFSGVEAAAAKMIGAVTVELRAGNIQGQSNLFTGAVTGLFNGFHQQGQGPVVIRQVRGKAPFIPHRQR